MVEVDLFYIMYMFNEEMDGFLLGGGIILK